MTHVNRKFREAWLPCWGSAVFLFDDILNESSVNTLEQRLPRRVILSIMATGLLSFMGILVETSLNVAFATLTHTMHVNLATIQWLTTGYLPVVTMVMLASAHLIKRYSVKTLFMFAIACFTIGCLINALAQNFLTMLIGRLIQAFATGLSTPLMFHIIWASVPRQRIATYNGLAAMMIAAAPALGPTYGGLLTSLWSWRWIFLVLMPLIVIVFFMGLFNLDLPALKPDDQFDGFGFILLAAGFTALDLAFGQAAQRGFLNWQFGGLFLLTVVLVLSYSAYNQRSQRHLIDFSIFKTKLITWHLLGYFLLQFINIGLAFVLPQVVQYVLHQSAFTAGMLVLPGSLLGAIAAPFAGRWLDNSARPIPIIIGHWLFLAGAAAFAIWGHQPTLLTIALFYSLLRMGFALAFGNSISDASRYVQPQQKADINAAFNTSQQYAGSLGTGVFAAVIGLTQQSHADVAVTTLTGAQIDYWLICGLAAIALFAAWRSYRQTQR